jgi:hypothetical protein
MHVYFFSHHVMFAVIALIVIKGKVIPVAGHGGP